jgi:hypothetical protein
VGQAQAGACGRTGRTWGQKDVSWGIVVEAEAAFPPIEKIERRNRYVAMDRRWLGGGFCSREDERDFRTGFIRRAGFSIPFVIGREEHNYCAGSGAGA